MNEISIPSQAEVAPDLYRVPNFSDAFRFASWRVFTLERTKLYKVGDVVWIVIADRLVKAKIAKVSYKEFDGAYRWIEKYRVNVAVKYDDRWSKHNSWIFPGRIRDGYERHAAMIASKLCMGQEYGRIGNA